MRRGIDMVEAISQVLDAHGAQLSVCMPGVAVSFSRLSQTAEVRPVTLRSGGEHRATVPNAPVVFPGVYWDIQPGEAGLLVIADEDWRTWWRTGEDSEPESVASHELSSAFFIPGLRSYPDSRPLPINAAVIPKPSATGFVYLGSDAGVRPVVHDRLLTALNTFVTALNTWGGTAWANWAAAAAGWTAGVTPSANALIAGFAADSYESPSVKVEE